MKMSNSQKMTELKKIIKQASELLSKTSNENDPLEAQDGKIEHQGFDFQDENDKDSVSMNRQYWQAQILQLEEELQQQINSTYEQNQKLTHKNQSDHQLSSSESSNLELSFVKNTEKPVEKKAATSTAFFVDNLINSDVYDSLDNKEADLLGPT